MTTSDETRPQLSRRQLTGDVVLALIVVAVTVWIQVAEVDSVPANTGPDAWSVLLAIASVLPLAVRRLRPLAVLIACVPAPLLLIAGHYSVGAAPLGVIIAFYTAIAWGSRDEARAAVLVQLLVVAAVALLRPIDLSLEGALVQLALSLGGWLMGTGVRERRELLAVREAETRREVQIARQQAELERERASRATAEERLRITRELHDVLGHALSVMVVQAGAAELLLDADPVAARSAMREIAATGRTSLADIRRVLGRLRDGEGGDRRIETSPALSDVPALAARVEAAGLPVRLHLDALSTPLPGVELAAYRVIQEALTNCLKHASASRAEVTVAVDDDWLRIEVRDDGTGRVDTNGTDGNAGTGQGQGLIGMRERVTVYGGALRAGPESGGYQVTARLPLGVDTADSADSAAGTP